MTRRGTAPRGPTSSSSRRTISRPISSMGWRTLVSGGIGRFATGESSKPTSGDVLRDPPAGRAKRRQGAGGHEVRGGEHGVEVRSGREEPLIAAAPASWVKSPTARGSGSRSRPARGEGLRGSRPAGRAGGHVGRPGDRGDRAPADGERCSTRRPAPWPLSTST